MHAADARQGLAVPSASIVLGLLWVLHGHGKVSWMLLVVGVVKAGGGGVGLVARVLVVRVGVVPGLGVVAGGVVPLLVVVVEGLLLGVDAVGCVGDMGPWVVLGVDGLLLGRGVLLLGV